MNAEPPSRTITLLFTDIEGSTQLWEKHPAGMPAAQPHFMLTAHNLAAVSQIVLRLNGIPLAIELAAVSFWTKSWA